MYTYTLMMKPLYPWFILDWGYPHSGSCRKIFTIYIYTIYLKYLHSDDANSLSQFILDWGYPHSGSCRGEGQRVATVA